MTRTPGNKKWLQNIAKKINLPLYPKKKFNGEEVTLMPDGTVQLSETGEKPSAEALEAYQDFVKKFNERLRRFGVRTIDGKATLNTVSRFSDDYYKKYAQTVTFLSICNFKRITSFKSTIVKKRTMS